MDDTHALSHRLRASLRSLPRQPATDKNRLADVEALQLLLRHQQRQLVDGAGTHTQLGLRDTVNFSSNLGRCAVTPAALRPAQTCARIRGMGANERSY